MSNVAEGAEELPRPLFKKDLVHCAKHIVSSILCVAPCVQPSAPLLVVDFASSLGSFWILHATLLVHILDFR